MTTEGSEGGKGATGRLWVIEPAAPLSDSRWQDRPVWRMVVVAAETASFARQTAEYWALPNVPQMGNESDSPRAGFLDEKLYHVRPAPPELAAKAGGGREPGVVAAHLLRDPPETIEI